MTKVLLILFCFSVLELLNGAVIPPEDEQIVPVFFDLSTTGLSPFKSEIIQIAAKAGKKEFSEFILPEKDIPEVVTSQNHFTKRDGHLYQNDQLIQTTDIKDALIKFIKFLKKVGAKKQVVLVAHNGIRFDAKFILHAMKRFDLLDSFVEIVAGFVDTINVIKSKAAGLENYKQEQLAQHFNVNADGDADASSNALGRVRELVQITQKAGIKDADLIDFAKPNSEIKLPEDKEFLEVARDFTEDKQPTPVVFDLTTTGLSPFKSEIIQIAAKAGTKEFNKFILPKNDLPAIVSKKGHFTKRDGHLYIDDELIETTGIKQALTSFIKFLKNVGGKEKVVLLAHNGIRFDAKFILHAMKRFNLLDSFVETVAGFVDTIKVIKVKAEGLKNYKQETLVKHFNIDGDASANALGRVRELEQIIQKIGIENADLIGFAKPISEIKLPEDKELLEAVKDLLSKDKEPIPVIFDLATTGLSLDKSEIIQIAAKAGTTEFNKFILPENDIPKLVSKKNHFTKRDGHLYEDDKPIQTTDMKKALSEFIKFLKKVGAKKQVLLVAHGIRFDARFILHAMERFELLKPFVQIVAGFADTIEVIKAKSEGIENHKQETLARHFEINSDGSQNALGHVRDLEQIIKNAGVENADLIDFSKPFWAFKFGLVG